MPKPFVPKPFIPKPPSFRKATPLPAMVVPNENPLDNVKPTGSIEGDVQAELTEMEKGFRERAKQEAERFDAATGAGEYFIVCFANGTQCDAFLRQLAAKVATIKLDTDDLVVDGRELAKALGYEIPPATAVGKLQKPDADFKARAREPGSD